MDKTTEMDKICSAKLRIQGQITGNNHEASDVKVCILSPDLCKKWEAMIEAEYDADNCVALKGVRVTTTRGCNHSSLLACYFKFVCLVAS